MMLMEGVVSVARLLLLFFSLVPTENQKYAVIFDGGSTGSRVHVFRFDHNMDLLPIANDYELYLAIKPGLSSYENDPKAAAESLRPLLEQAEAVIPQELRSKTPLRLGATAGLRLLPGNSSEVILEAVREYFKNESSLNYKKEWVGVLDGTDEGAYMWEAINYLLGNFGKEYSETVGVVDLGGGSVQMNYAISQDAAENAPDRSPSGGPYVVNRLLRTNYHIYTHSYLNYGLLAARAQSLSLSGASGNPCVTNGYSGTYEYSGVVYKVSALKSGTNMRRCRALTRKMLIIDRPCLHKNCSFNGVWNGGGGAGVNNLYIASFFYDTAAETGIVKGNANKAVIRPIAYRDAAKRACSANVDNIKSLFPSVDDRDVPFLCMDLVYEYTLLVDGFRIDPFEEVTVVTSLEYKGSLIGAAWPLGCAVELLSDSDSE